MNEINFDAAFAALTGNDPFPWQRNLYERFVSDRPDNIPTTATLPTGLGKTAVVAVWLLALATLPARVPRRLVYVVNRRTVVDQATREAEKLRDRLPRVPEMMARLLGLAREPGGVPLAISTLRGQKAESNEWWENPARPAVLVGTVDLIGSRLLFQGYRASYKRRPLFAGFLGHDALIVHDEAHLEKPFQDLLLHVRNEQAGRGLKPFRVIALTATPRGGEDVFELTDAEKDPPESLPERPTEPIHHVWKRLKATKTLSLHRANDDKAGVVAKVVEQAAKFKDDGSKPAVLVFVRTVKAVSEVRDALTRKHKVESKAVCVLTGTMRGRERDRMADPRRPDADPVFARFLKRPKPDDPPEDQWRIEPREGTVYLICTAAGEVGVDISADHLVCDLSTFESMAQRFGRVNRYGERSDTTVAVVYPDKFDEKHPLTAPRRLTHQLLAGLEKPDVSPLALGKLDPERRLVAFAPTHPAPTPTDIVYDAWALTSVCKQLTGAEDLPGRPPVADYLHGITDDDPETQVAWRSEVCWLGQAGLSAKELTKLLDDYPLKPHELLRSPSYQVREWLASLAADDRRRALPVWVVSVRGDVTAHTLGELSSTRPGDKKAYLVAVEGRTIVLPPEAGGLKADGMIGPTEPDVVFDVADELESQGRPARHHALTDGLSVPAGAAGMRLVQSIPLREDEAPEPGAGTACDETAGKSHARFFARPWEADDDGSERTAGKWPVAWQVHTDDVVGHAHRLADALLTGREREALILAAHLHDLGKCRAMWQAGIGNRGYPGVAWAKSGSRRGGFLHDYRHEFGSLLDAAGTAAFRDLTDGDTKDLVLHLIATHHGRGRPHFPADEAFEPEPRGRDVEAVATEVPRRFARLQRKYGRWGLAYLESLLRAADSIASACPSEFMESTE